MKKYTRNQYYRLEIDSPIETYDIMRPCIKQLKGVEGISCEIGLRRGGGTRIILEAFLENDDPRTHICLDPYGNILYYDKEGPHRSDYTNNMRNETLAELYRYANNNYLNIIFFNLEDSEFYQRFADGVPVYEEDKKIINNYCFVHIDGQHDLNHVMLATQFFIPRVSTGGLLVFDNTDHYNHQLIHNLLSVNKFKLYEDLKNKLIYKK